MCWLAATSNPASRASPSRQGSPACAGARHAQRQAGHAPALPPPRSPACSIPPQTAHTWVAKKRSLDRALAALRLERRFAAAATPEYAAGAARAALAFSHALVFCPATRGGACARLRPPPDCDCGSGGGDCGSGAAGLDLSHLGQPLDDELARGVAYGYLHPHPPHAPFDASAPLPAPLPPSIATRRRGIGAWCTEAAASGRETLPGLGPTRQQPVQQGQCRAQLQRQQQGSGMADIVMSASGVAATRAAQQQQQQQQQQSGVPRSGGQAANPFVRLVAQQSEQQQPGAEPSSPSLPSPASCEGPVMDAAARVRGGCEAGSVRAAACLAAAAAAHGGVQPPLVRQGMNAQIRSCSSADGGSLAQMLEQCGSWEETQTEIEVDLTSEPSFGGGAGDGHAAAVGAGRQPMRPLDNQQLERHVTVCVGQQGTPKVTAAAARSGGVGGSSGKRKAGGGSSGDGKKKRAPLAPPQQRISRFFAPVAKPT